MSTLAIVGLGYVEPPLVVESGKLRPTLGLACVEGKVANSWVVSGNAEVTNCELVTLVPEYQSIYIPLGQVHRLANLGKVPFEIIEVPSRRHLGEDDIERYEDSHGRR